MRRYDTVEPSSLTSLSKVQLVDQNKGAKVSGEKLKKAIANFYFTDPISRRHVLQDPFLQYGRLPFCADTSS
jgi:NADH dehydrogenase (ubiquinone) Fe-S protein 1